MNDRSNADDDKWISSGSKRGATGCLVVLALLVFFVLAILSMAHR